MTTIFTLTNDPEPVDKINLDDLYERRKEDNLETVRTYNRILNKIHDRIKYVASQRNMDQIAWYIIPEVIIGVPKYDHAECVRYIMGKLIDNGFRAKYIHPNLVCVCWAHYVPNYVRSEIKKKTGIRVDEEGKRIVDEDDEDDDDDNELFNAKSFSTSAVGGGGGGSGGRRQSPRVSKPSVRFNLKKNRSSEPNETSDYRPTGKMVYNSTVIETLQSRLSKTGRDG